MKTTRRLIAALALLGLLCAAGPVFAQRANSTESGFDSTPIPIKQEVPIPQAGLLPYDKGNTDGTVRDIADYIGRIYNFGIAIVGLVAAAMFMIGGFQYLTSGGNQDQITAGKKRIFDALIGMILTLSAYVILFTINPALLTLQLPGGLHSIKQEISFLPFCDALAKTFNVEESKITVLKQNHRVHGRCGDAGFLLTKIKNQDGTVTDSRNWCVFRGERQPAHQTYVEGGAIPSDYGCEDNNDIQGERVIGYMNVHSLSICMPINGISQAELNADYEKVKDKPPADQVVRTVGACQSCNALHDGTAKRLGLPVGDRACQIWQNVANNGDPDDQDFAISRKLQKIVQDSRILGADDHTFRMYYCGYSSNHHSCIYVPIHCQHISNCKDYEEQVMNYCEAEDSKAEITCHASQELGSKRFQQTGNAAHLIPVCSGNPCEVKGKGCSVDGLAGLRNTAVIGHAVGSTLRVGVTIVTGSLLGTIDCSNKK